MRQLPLISLSLILAGFIILSQNTTIHKVLSPDKEFIIPSAKLPLDKIKLPLGFSISVYAEVAGALSMAMSPEGTLFVGTQRSGFVYAVKDTNNDQIADKKWVIASGMNNPNGVAIKNGNLYVAEISKVTTFPDIENNLSNPGNVQCQNLTCRNEGL